MSLVQCHLLDLELWNTPLRQALEQLFPDIFGPLGILKICGDDVLAMSSGNAFTPHSLKCVS